MITNISQLRFINIKNGKKIIVFGVNVNVVELLSYLEPSWDVLKGPSFTFSPYTRESTW